MRSLRPLLLWSSLSLVAWAGYAASQVVPSPGPPTGIACAFNTVPPTLTNGQAGWVQCDNAGKIITSGGGGGGGAVTIADGADVTQGTTTDAACATDNGTCTVEAVAKRIAQRLTTLITNLGSANANGGATPANSSPVVNANQYSAYETIAASQTAQVLGGSGAAGDYLSHCVIYPVSTSPGVVTVFDNANAAGTNVIAFAGGATSTSNLTPISVPVGAFSTAGAWKVTTGTNVIVTCYGKFS